jgi:small subunit ribosomal protein S14
MPKLSVAHRNIKRRKTVARFKSKRDLLRVAIINPNLTEEERNEARIQLQKQPRDASPVRVRNRCKLCERPRAYNRLTGLCRLHMRLMTINGFVTGMGKASW